MYYAFSSIDNSEDNIIIIDIIKSIGFTSLYLDWSIYFLYNRTFIELIP